ncbi:tRNA/rRNA methyltransferase [Shewanella sp. JM162201]|uniref:tRNA/rRNA methyltransferase n=1 Tax=Shewanella jiangmenensis TaxID=2837387 RepID=A0ABS5V4U7_9GAMM|nr:tRNA/rRNA methyltransferase [Shewanella jiangmenensis]
MDGKGQRQHEPRSHRRDERDDARADGRHHDKPRYDKPGSDKPRYDKPQRAEPGSDGYRTGAPRAEREHDRREDGRHEHKSHEYKNHGHKSREHKRHDYAKQDKSQRGAGTAWGAQARSDVDEFADRPSKGFDEKEQRLNETRLYGINACRETFKHRRDDVVKLYLDEATAPKFADVMKHLAKTRKAYHVVGEEELERIAGSQHHGGVVMVVRKKPVADIFAYLARQKKQRDCLLALDGVGNPHNLGAIMRSCAHFGVSGIVMTEAGLLQSGAAARTAEGGMEHVEGISTARLTDALQACRQAGYTIITTSSHGGESLYASKLPAKVVVVFGEEMDGVSKAVASRADIGVQIPGSGLVESLNVSVAASLILGEWYRQQL